MVSVDARVKARSGQETVIYLVYVSGAMVLWCYGAMAATTTTTVEKDSDTIPIYCWIWAQRCLIFVLSFFYMGVMLGGFLLYICLEGQGISRNHLLSYRIHDSIPFSVVVEMYVVS